MDARAALLHLWTALVLLKATLNRADAAEVYANTWAVEIEGGPEEADRIAREHGFVNHGNVSRIRTTLCALECKSTRGPQRGKRALKTLRCALK